MRSFFLTLTILLFPLYSFAQLSPAFSQKEVLEDLETLRRAIEEGQYNMFAYTSEQEFNATYDEITSSLTADSLSRLETINMYQRLVSSLDIGHTNIDFPIGPYMEYAQSGGTLLPLEIAFQDEKPLVRKNWSGNKNIPIGSELISINGKPIDQILQRIYPQISAERPYFKRAKIEIYSFPRYYWQVFGQEDQFEVVVSIDGITKTATLDAINLIEDFEMKRDEVLNTSMELRFYDEAAYLNPGSFSGDEARYQRFIDSAFVEINASERDKLIIDLRNNKGGNDSFSDYLVSYFADKPFKWVSSFTLKTSRILKEHARANSDTTSDYWRAALEHEDGTIYDYEFDLYEPQAKEKQFNGKVYVLVNRQSHSQSAVAAAQIQDYGFGTIVGEETGEYPTLYASIFPYTLPNTDITVTISKGYMVRVNGSEEQRGVIPDIVISDYLRDEEDEILNGLLDQISTQNP
jgi:hypothetical protein